MKLSPYQLHKVKVATPVHIIKENDIFDDKFEIITIPTFKIYSIKLIKEKHFVC